MDIIIHDHQLRVRYKETDKMGVVYNGNYLTYFEIGRTELMRTAGYPYIRFEEEGYYLPLIESHAEYIKSAHYDDILTIRSSIKPVISARVRFDYEVYRDDELLTRGYTGHCFMDIATMKAVRPPKSFVDFIKEVSKK